MDQIKIETTIKELIAQLGEDPEREGLLDTPRRVAKYYQEVLSGYNQDYQKVATTFTNEGGQELVVVRDIEFFSLCEHHMVPFFGKVLVGYVPNQKILGLSKFARIIDVFARRLQVQERLTKEVLEALVSTLEPLGCGIKIEAKHMCMSMRGIKCKSAQTITSGYFGILKTDYNLRREFLETTS